MIVVLDTNVWISGLVFARNKGVPTQAIARAMTYDTIATSEEIEAEILRVLTGKFRWELPRAEDTLAVVLERSLRVRLRGTVQICRDPNDDMFLECAQRAKAHVLVAGDKDLLVLGNYLETKIVTPAEYLKMAII